MSLQNRTRTVFHSEYDCNLDEIMKKIKHTHASAASVTDPNVQKLEKTIIHIPLFNGGTDSRNQDKNTGPPPRPKPAKPRRITNDI